MTTERQLLLDCLPNTTILVVRADGPDQPTLLEQSLDQTGVLYWCKPGADLGDARYNIVLLANADRTPDMVDWVASEVTTHMALGGRYQWRDRSG
jgi:hypothetical protein